MDPQRGSPPAAADTCPVRAKIIPVTIAGVLALTTGVALAETSPADPEVVLSPVDDTTTTTEAPPETTTTTTVVVDEPDELPETEVVEPEAELEGGVPEAEAPEVEAPGTHPENHGLYVSQAAHDHEGEGHHGAAVSEVARTDVGKHHGGSGAPEEDREDGPEED